MIHIISLCLIASPDLQILRRFCCWLARSTLVADRDLLLPGGAAMNGWPALQCKKSSVRFPSLSCRHLTHSKIASMQHPSNNKAGASPDVRAMRTFEQLCTPTTMRLCQTKPLRMQVKQDPMTGKVPHCHMPPVVNPTTPCPSNPSNNRDVDCQVRPR